VYFNVNFNVFFKLIIVHLLVSEFYIHQNVRCNDKKNHNEKLCQMSLVLWIFNNSLPHMKPYYVLVKTRFTNSV